MWESSIPPHLTYMRCSRKFHHVFHQNRHKSDHVASSPPPPCSEHSSGAWTTSGPPCPSPIHISPIPLLHIAARQSMLKGQFKEVLLCFDFILTLEPWRSGPSNFISCLSSHCFLCTSPSNLLTRSQAQPVPCSSCDFMNVILSACNTSLYISCGRLLPIHLHEAFPCTVHSPAMCLFISLKQFSQSALISFVCFGII